MEQFIPQFTEASVDGDTLAELYQDQVSVDLCYRPLPDRLLTTY